MEGSGSRQPALVFDVAGNLQSGRAIESGDECYHIMQANAEDQRVNRLVQLKEYMAFYGFDGASTLIKELGPLYRKNL